MIQVYRQQVGSLVRPNDSNEGCGGHEPDKIFAMGITSNEPPRHGREVGEEICSCRGDDQDFQRARHRVPDVAYGCQC